MVALQCCMSAIFTKSKIKDNYLRNFSQSALFPETKLAAELTNMLKFLNIIKYFWGNYSMATRVEYICDKFDKTTKLAILKLNCLAQKDSRETVEAPEEFITIFSANYV